MSLLEGKKLVWDSQVSNPSGEIFLELFDNNDFEISGLQSPSH